MRVEMVNLRQPVLFADDPGRPQVCIFNLSAGGAENIPQGRDMIEDLDTGSGYQPDHIDLHVVTAADGKMQGIKVGVEQAQFLLDEQSGIGQGHSSECNLTHLRNGGLSVAIDDKFRVQIRPTWNRQLSYLPWPWYEAVNEKPGRGPPLSPMCHFPT